MKRPAIGITGPDKCGKAAWIFTALSVWLAGGRPIHITPSKPRAPNKLHGFVIGGGSDIDPNTYQKENFIDEYLDQTLRDERKSFFKKIGSFFSWLLYPLVFMIRILFSRKSHTLDKERDQLEFGLLHQAVENNLPVLGICRGAQLINVYFKGTLYEDISTFYYEEPNRYSIFPVKKIYVKPDSKLAEILGVKELEVNALHHQAVKKAGNNIEIVAREPNEVVQGIESTAKNFILGVQWHPEYLIQKKRQRRIFKALVEAADCG